MRVGAASMIAAHDLLGEARARRVDDEDVGAAGLLDEVAQRRAHVAREEARVADLVAPGVGDRVGDRLLDDLQAPHLAGARGQRQPDRADAAEEVEDALPALQARVLARDAVEPLGHLGVRLEERVGAIAKRRPASSSSIASRPVQHRSTPPAVVSATPAARVQNRPSAPTASARPVGSSGASEVTRRTCSSPVRRPSRTTRLRSRPSCVRRSQARRPAVAAPGEHRLARRVAALGDEQAVRQRDDPLPRAGRVEAADEPAVVACRRRTRPCCGSATPARRGRSARARSRRACRCAAARRRPAPA